MSRYEQWVPGANFVEHSICMEMIPQFRSEKERFFSMLVDLGSMAQLSPRNLGHGQGVKTQASRKAACRFFMNLIEQRGLRDREGLLYLKHRAPQEAFIEIHRGE